MKKSKNWKLENYQGWSNYYTWNIILYLNNVHSLYTLVEEWKKGVLNHKPGYKKSYNNLMKITGMCAGYTPDGVPFMHASIKRREIINAIFEE